MSIDTPAFASIIYRIFEFHFSILKPSAWQYCSKRDWVIADNLSSVVAL